MTRVTVTVLTFNLLSPDHATGRGAAP